MRRAQHRRLHQLQQLQRNCRPQQIILLSVERPLNLLPRRRHSRRCPPAATASAKSAAAARAAQTPAASPAPASASLPQTLPDRAGTAPKARRTQSPASTSRSCANRPVAASSEIASQNSRPGAPSADICINSPSSRPTSIPTASALSPTPQQSPTADSRSNPLRSSQFTITLLPLWYWNGNRIRPSSSSGILAQASNRPSSPTKRLLNLRYLWRTRSFQPLVPCGQDRTFHTDPLLFTALFNPPVGVVGNIGRLTRTFTPLSKTPDSHSHDLENCAPLQPLPRQPHRKLSHFSSLNLVLLSFLLLFLPFSSTRRAFFHLWNQSPLSTLLIPLAASKLAQRLNQSTLSREAPRFPRTLKRKDEYNQEEENAADFAGEQWVVKCGQSERIASGPERHVCRSLKPKSRNRPRRGQRWRLP